MKIPKRPKIFKDAPTSASRDVSTASSGPSSMGSVMMRSLFWSLVQNWGGRMMNFVQFIVLAKFLAPHDFGLAAAAAIVTLFITLVAEFGFSDAIIQAKDLDDDDINFPFWLSMGVSFSLAGGAALLSNTIENWLHVEGLSKIVLALAAIGPISTFSLFQEAIYKRHLQYKKLALRVMLANLIATCVSIPCAWAGFGVWSLVVQTYLVAIIGAVWMWSQPLWTPKFVFRSVALKKLSRFGVFILAMRLLDFGSTRLVEVLIVGRYGVQSYGFYTASAKLNQTLMDLLQSALNDVSLSLLSRISDQKERLASTYRTSIAIAGNAVPVIFVMVAAISREICAVLFDARWSGIDRLSTPLFILGAVQALQFFSRPYLSARGRSEVVLVISIAKFALIVGALWLSPAKDIYSLVYWFVAAQLLSAPISFGLTARELGVPYLQIYRDLFPVAAACYAGYLAVSSLRPLIGERVNFAPLLMGIVLGGVFVIAYIPVISIFGRRQLGVAANFITARVRERS